MYEQKNLSDWDVYSQILSWLAFGQILLIIFAKVVFFSVLIALSERVREVSEKASLGGRMG
jgi:hypothetical protein